MSRFRNQFFACLLCISYLFNTAFTSLPGVCPEGCSGHGVCNLETKLCDCISGYLGVDCSLRTCPSNRAWVDIPTQNNTAHAPFTECSNMGTCVRSVGICQCRLGYTGPACEQTLCPYGPTSQGSFAFTGETASCSGNGRCMSLRQLSLYTDYRNYFGGEEYNGWDADRIFGCACEKGFTGPNCDQKECPRGDDPSTPGVDETQLIDCKCDSCTGGFYLTIHGQQTQFIPYDASPELIKYRLEQLEPVEMVAVKFVQGAQLCSSTGSITRITFQLPVSKWGNLGLLQVNGLRGPIVAVRTKGIFSRLNSTLHSTQRTKEITECSNRGICDRSTGVCGCIPGYESSDGLGKRGSKGDCGYRTQFSYTYKTENSTITSVCPVSNDRICSGHGKCSTATGTCLCNSPYTGLNCSLIECPDVPMWFGIVGRNHVNKAPCGNIGYCDYGTGICGKCSGTSKFTHFAGPSCQVMTCPTDLLGVPCGGNGTCLSLRKLTQFSYTPQKEIRPVIYDQPWDANMIRGCACHRAISVDNQYDLHYTAVTGSSFVNITNNSIAVNFLDNDDIIKYYRGPYSFAATDFKGYDCGQMLCPKGNYPFNHLGQNEIQRINCTSVVGGTFALIFRENHSLPINSNDTIYELKQRLEQLLTISKVAVRKNSEVFNDTICSAQGNYSIFVEFLTEFGDLPLMKWRRLSGDINLVISQYQKGTKTDLECSAMGICDEYSGVCKCKTGFGSSNGSLDSAGQRGDCSYFSELYTHKQHMTSMVGFTGIPKRDVEV